MAKLNFHALRDSFYVVFAYYQNWDLAKPYIKGGTAESNYSNAWIKNITQLEHELNKIDQNNQLQQNQKFDLFVRQIQFALEKHDGGGFFSRSRSHELLELFSDLRFEQEYDVNKLEAAFGLKVFTEEDPSPNSLKSVYLLYALQRELSERKFDNVDAKKEIDSLIERVTKSEEMKLTSLRKALYKVSGVSACEPAKIAIAKTFSAPTFLEDNSNDVNAGAGAILSKEDIDQAASAEQSAEPEREGMFCRIQ